INAARAPSTNASCGGLTFGIQLFHPSLVNRSKWRAPSVSIQRAIPVTMRCNPSSSKPPCSPQIMISPVEISIRWRSVLPVRAPPANTNTGGCLGSATTSVILDHDVRELGREVLGLLRDEHRGPARDLPVDCRGLAVSRPVLG